MKATIQYIEQELRDLYPKTEIRAFTRLILEHVCGISYTQQVLMKDQLLDDSFKNTISEMVKRLKNHEPIQYILGETEFLGLKLIVTPPVLIPRPETEELVLWIAETEMPEAPALLDVGTGSGCIALALKDRIADASVSAFDFLPQALEVAGKNAELNKLEVEFFKADIMKWETSTWRNFDAIISNPPYVRESEKENMSANVLNYESQKALFVPDNDPLIYYRQITQFARRYLNENGWLFFEINENLGNETIDLVRQCGYKEAELKKDLFGKNRMLRCRK